MHALTISQSPPELFQSSLRPLTRIKSPTAPRVACVNQYNARVHCSAGERKYRDIAPLCPLRPSTALNPQSVRTSASLQSPSFPPHTIPFSLNLTPSWPLVAPMPPTSRPPLELSTSFYDDYIYSMPSTVTVTLRGTRSVLRLPFGLIWTGDVTHVSGPNEPK